MARRPLSECIKVCAERPGAKAASTSADAAIEGAEDEEGPRAEREWNTKDLGVSEDRRARHDESAACARRGSHGSPPLARTLAPVTPSRRTLRFRPTSAAPRASAGRRRVPRRSRRARARRGGRRAGSGGAATRDWCVCAHLASPGARSSAIPAGGTLDPYHGGMLLALAIGLLIQGRDGDYDTGYAEIGSPTEMLEAGPWRAWLDTPGGELPVGP